MLSRLATWVSTPEGQAFKWTLIIEGTAILAEVVQKVIEVRLAHPKKFPLPLSVLFEISAVHWDLIFLGFATLIGSFLAAPRTRRAPNVLLGPYVAVVVAVLLFVLLDLVGPWIGPLWLRIALADTIGLVVMYYCVRRAAKVRIR